MKAHISFHLSTIEKFYPYVKIRVVIKRTSTLSENPYFINAEYFPPCLSIPSYPPLPYVVVNTTNTFIYVYVIEGKLIFSVIFNIVFFFFYVPLGIKFLFVWPNWYLRRTSLELISWVVVRETSCILTYVSFILPTCLRYSFFFLFSGHRTVLWISDVFRINSLVIFKKII